MRSDQAGVQRSHDDYSQTNYGQRYGQSSIGGHGSRALNETGRDMTSAVTDSMVWVTDQMIRWPMWVTSASLQLMLDGMQRVTGAQGSQGGNTGSLSSSSSSGEGTSGSAASTLASAPSQAVTEGQQSGARLASQIFGGQGSGSGRQSGQSSTSQSGGGSYDQDLQANDLKFVTWAIAFTKPGLECVLEPQQNELVNYSTDGSGFAALKIAKFMERSRFGKIEKPSGWSERSYPSEPQGNRNRPEPTGRSADADKDKPEKGWRIPAEDQKYIQFLYRVDWRLPKHESEVTRVERVTVERGTTTNSSTAVA